jgi:hypothetical protein
VERGAIRLGSAATEILNEESIGQDYYYRVPGAPAPVARQTSPQESLPKQLHFS